MQNICLIGMPSSGKSAIGKALATQLKRKFFDIDTEIERLEHKKISELYYERGEDYLTKLETELATRYLMGHDPIVLTLSSSILNPESLQAIKALSTIIWIKPSINILAERLKQHPSHRSFIIQGTLHQNLEEVETQRLAYYSLADYTLEITDAQALSTKNASLIIEQLDASMQNFFNL